jgi:simple sugar transport system permease protein
MSDLSIEILLASVLAGAAPMVLAAMGETLTERVGVINLSLDGAILLSAMAAFAAAYETKNVYWGFLAGASVGAAIAGLVAVCSVYLSMSQVAVGFVLTLMCRDLAYFLGNPYARVPGPQLEQQFLPFLGNIPVLGPVLFQQNVLVPFSILLAGISWWFLFRTKWGLYLRSVGENPQAAYARGLNTKTLQVIYTLVGGLLIGLSGAAFSLCTKPGWGRPQGAEGMGWIALAIVIFGGWHPIKTALGAYLFSLLQILGISFQNLWPSVPAQVFQVAPFPLMIFTLIFIHLSQQSKARQLAERFPPLRPLLGFLRVSPPSALGKTYRKE